MDEESMERVPSDRTVEQAIMAVKKGAYLLKCDGSRKPRVCPFKISMDEKFLLWHSGKEEKQLRLSSITEVIFGQKTVNFQKQLQIDREMQSFSLIYADGKRSIDLICKDQAQANSWYLGLKTIISRCHQSRPFTSFRSPIGVQTCVNSPAGFLRRKYNMGLFEDITGSTQVRSLCGSPALSLSKRCFSEASSNSFDSFYSSESSMSQIHDMTHSTNPAFSSAEPKNPKKTESCYASREIQKDLPRWFTSSDCGSSYIEPNKKLKDVFIWGEGVAGTLGGVIDKSVDSSRRPRDSLLPRLIESAMMLDVEHLSLGGKHAALVTRHGEVFSWGDANRGKLGHKINLDTSHPKLVEALTKVHVNSVVCGEYQTCAITLSGELYAWGDYYVGSDFMVGERSRSQWLPCKISVPYEGIKISSVSCGIWHMAIVSTTGHLFTFGDGTFGVLGHGDFQSISQPKEVDSLRGLRVKSVACGHWHTAAIVEVASDRLLVSGLGGKLFTWGDGDKGRLGHGDQERKPIPTRVENLIDHDFVQVSCGRTLTVALTKSGKVLTFGSVMHGQLGSQQAMENSITMVEGKLKDDFVIQIATGSYHTAALTARGIVYVWGKGANGQLGLADTKDRASPTLVDALCDRKVETVVCGSNMTAAICVHKSVSIGDQTSCSRCRVPFGFTRRKHNCYNCGSLVCHACSSNKARNASLAPNRNKASRVCDQCFYNLQMETHSNFERDSQRQQLTTQTRVSDEKETHSNRSTPRLCLTLPSNQCSVAEWQSTEMLISKDRKEDQKDLDSTPSLSPRLPQWGQVRCPASFESSTESASLSRVRALSLSPMHLHSSPLEIVPESAEMLTEEVCRLRNQERDLKEQCLIGNRKIQECQRKLEETWSLAREEAAKCKVANEVIKALALQLHKLSTRTSAGSGTNEGIDVRITQSVSLDSPALKTRENIIKRGASPSPDELNVMKDQRVRFSCGLTEASKPLYGREKRWSDTRLLHSHAAKRGGRQNGTKDFGLEWVEEYEPGIHLTFTILPSGQKGLKRVRFSRKHFSEEEAERWWEEHQIVVYEKYDLQGYAKSSYKAMESTP